MIGSAARWRRWVGSARGLSGLRAVAWLAILGLAAVVLWLLSERNARTYALVPEGGSLVVKKGFLAPYGRSTFKTDEPGLALAYAPLKPPHGASVQEERSFDDRSALDQALYDLLARWARDDIATGKAEQLDRGLGYLARADRLAGISAAQREDLKALRAESGFFEARRLLEQGADALRQARERLRLTAGSSSPRAGDAAESLRRLDPLLDEMHQAVKPLRATPAERAPEAPAATPAPPAPGASPDGSVR